MVKRRNLNDPPEKKLADIIRERKEEARSSKTGAAGVKDLGENGDVVWPGLDPVTGLPVQKSVKRFSVELDDTTEKAAELEEKLNTAREDLDRAQTDLDAAEANLDALDTRVDDAARNSENKVVNPGFEAGFQSWIGSGGADETSVDASRSHSGAQSLRLVSSQAATQGSIPVTEGQIWEASAWFLYVGTDSTLNGGLRLQRSADGTTWVNVDSAANVVPSVSGWQQIRHDYVVPAGVAFIRARAAFSTFSGTVWVDDFSLRDVTAIRTVQQGVAAADAKAVAAQAAALEAKGAAEQAAIDAAGKTEVIYSDTAPEGSEDILWFDTSIGNVPKVWDAPLGDTARRNELVNPFGPTLTSASGWAAIRGDVSVVTDEGRPAVRVLANATGGTYIDPTARISPPVGTQVRFSVEVKVTADTTGMRLSTSSYSGAATSGNTMPYTTQTVADGWVRYDLTVTVTAMPSGAYLRTLVWPQGTAFAVGQGFLLRNAIVEYDTSGVWFDGSIPPARWTGAANASASIYDGPIWRSLRDEGVQAAQDAAAAAMAQARYAPRIADRAPTEADGSSKPDGAGWYQYDPNTSLLIQVWRWTGTEWERLNMDPVMIPVIQIGTGTFGDLTGDRVTVTGEFVARVAQILQLDVGNLVVTGTANVNELVAQAMAAATAEIQEAYIQNLRTNGAMIDQAVIGDLAANIITSGLFRTAESGQRWEIDSNGIVMFGVDDEGIEYELVRLGPSGTNLITVGQTSVAPDSVSTPQGNFQELNVGGRSVAELLNDLPKGVVAWGRITQDSNYDSSTAGARRAEIQTYLEPNRLYRLQASQHFVNTNVTTGARLVEKLKWSLDSTPIFVEDSAGVTTGTSGRYYLQNNAAYTIPPQSCIIDSAGWSARKIFWAMHIMYSEGSAPIRLLGRSDYPLTLMIEDLGPSKPAYIKRWNDNNEGGSQDPGPAPVQTYTKTYDSNGFRCYNLDGSDAGRSDVVHGLYSGGPSNFRRRGGWTFPTMTGDLAGATVEKIEMYAYCHQTHYSTGSTVNPAVWGGVMASNLTAFTSIYGWKAGQGKWITLPSTYHAGFKSGQYAGVGVIPTSGSAEQYARFNPSGAKIRITYTK